MGERSGLKRFIPGRVSDTLLYDRARTISWRVKEEIYFWRFSIIAGLPGEIGVALRRRLVNKLCGECGKNPVILEGLVIENPRKLFIGDNVRIAKRVHLSAGGTIRIGNNVLIGPCVQIWSINHVYRDSDTIIWHQGYETAPVIIGDDTWIGAGAQICPGVTIGAGSVLGAGTILRKSVRPFSIVQGNPGRVVGQRIPAHEWIKNPISD